MFAQASSFVELLEPLAQPLDILVGCLATAADKEGLEIAFRTSIVDHLLQLGLPRVLPWLVSHVVQGRHLTVFVCS